MQCFREPTGAGRNRLRKPGAQVFVFFIFLMMLCWPILTIAEALESFGSVMVCLFGLWAAMIAVTFSITISCQAKRRPATTVKGKT